MGRIVVFTGGGTGGHVFPGIAVIEQLQRADPALEVVWIGSNSPLERRIVSRFGVRYIAIPSGKLRRYLSVKNFLDLFKIFAGLVASTVILLRLRPLLVFSKGGFVSVPPVVAAGLLGIPVFTHESDVDPGLATRINARFAERIFVAYEESRGYYAGGDHPGVIVSGNPVRDEILSGDAERGRELVGAAASPLPLLLILGGSQGARQVNELVEAVLDRLCSDYYVVQQMGAAGFRPSDRDGVYRTAFFDEGYPDVLAAADLVIGRSGAGTLWELAASGTPSVLIPLESFSRGDQLTNARQFEGRGAAVVLSGEAATPEALAGAVHGLARDAEKRSAMARAARSIFTGNAAERIAQEILTRIGGANGHRAT